MGGGFFDHDQFKIGEIADKIEDCISTSENENSDEGFWKFEEQTIREFKRTVNFLRLAQISAHRIDWLLSGDDDEQTYRKRLLEDLTKYSKEIK